MFLPRDIIRFETCKSATHFLRLGPSRPPKASNSKRKPEDFAFPGNRARVIWVRDSWVFLFNMECAKTDIWKCHTHVLTRMHLDGEVTRQDEDGSWVKAAEALSSEAQLKHRDELLEAIAPLLAQTPDIFESAFRGHAVAKRVPAAGKTAKTLHSALHRYWLHGMVGNALLPRFDRIGTPLKRDRQTPRPRRIGKVALGAIPKDNERKAAIIDDEMRKLFERMTNAHYRRKRTASLRFVHDQIVGFLKSVARVDQESGRIVIDEKRSKLARKGIPTFRQYQYWYQTSGRKLSDDIVRTGETRFQKDRRATLGSSISDLYGIGSRFEIDSTPLDVACVSERDRRRLVGRPTLYVVVDVFSKMIVGIHVGYQDASWQAARLAIRNVVEDKVQFCNRFGLAISHDEWPVREMLPSRILADRGEFEGYNATDFVAKTGVTVENTAPYRGDMKGTVEKRFDMIHRYLRQLVPGTVTKDHAERGDADYRREAKLNLTELTKVIIQIVLYLNNAHRLESAHQPGDMVDDNVPPIPRDMWKWAENYGRTELRKISYPELEFSMLELAKASTSHQGLRFRGMFFYSADLHAEGKFLRGARSEVDISWDPQSTNLIWRHMPGGGYEACPLTHQSQEYADRTFREAEQLRYKRGLENAAGRQVSAKALYDISVSVDADFEAARAQSSTKLSANSVTGAAAERRHEKIMERVRERARSESAAKAHAQDTNPQSGPKRSRASDYFNMPG